MQRIFDINGISSAVAPRESLWTAIIPAAGRGTRLGYNSPKVLYPVLGLPILSWTLRLLSPFCQSLVWVVSSEGSKAVRPHLTKAVGRRAKAVIQKQPTGMADAIALCEDHVHTPYTLVLWGDQIATHPRTLIACMRLMEGPGHWSAVLPTYRRKNPYIHFYRDAAERIVKVYEARESRVRRATGENDCGVFLFRTKALFNVLRKTRGRSDYRGAITHENNFLGLIPLFDRAPDRLASVRIHDPEETLGINTREDARRVATVLKKRHEDF